MITQEQISALYGLDVYDHTGDKVGSIQTVWSDDAGQPAWAGVRTGWFGLGESLVPLHDAEVQGASVLVPFEKAKIKDAPHVSASADEPLSADEVARLRTYYGMRRQGGSRLHRHTPRQFTGDGNVDDAMTRSEERLTVHTETEPVGRARLRKYVETEREQVDVPVRRERARIEREKITDANRASAYDGPEITEAEHEVVLHAERPVANTETVAVEKVRLGKETVTDQRTVEGKVRREHIEADLPDEGRHRIG